MGIYAPELYRWWLTWYESLYVLRRRNRDWKSTTNRSHCSGIVRSTTAERVRGSQRVDWRCTVGMCGRELGILEPSGRLHLTWSETRSRGTCRSRVDWESDPILAFGVPAGQPQNFKPIIPPRPCFHAQLQRGQRFWGQLASEMAHKGRYEYPASGSRRVKREVV
jgi:hypothetical protein